MIAVLTRRASWAVVDLRRDYSATFDSQYSGTFPDGESFQIYTCPERLHGAKISRYITLTHSEYSRRDWQELHEMEAIAEARLR